MLSVRDITKIQVHEVTRAFSILIDTLIAHELDLEKGSMRRIADETLGKVHYREAHSGWIGCLMDWKLAERFEMSS